MPKYVFINKVYTKMKNRIRLTESQLRKVIKESVYRILNEDGEIPQKARTKGCVDVSADVRVYKKINYKRTANGKKIPIWTSDTEKIPSPNGKGEYGLKKQFNVDKNYSALSSTEERYHTFCYLYPQSIQGRYSELSGGIDGEGNDWKEKANSIIKNSAHKFIEEDLPTYIKLANNNFKKEIEETKDYEGNPYYNSVLTNYFDGCQEFVKVYLYIKITHTHDENKNGDATYTEYPYGGERKPEASGAVHQQMLDYQY